MCFARGAHDKKSRGDERVSKERRDGWWIFARRRENDSLRERRENAKKWSRREILAPECGIERLSTGATCRVSRRVGIARRTASVSVARGVSAGSWPACAALSPCAGVVNPTDGAGEFPSGAVRSESRRFATGFAAPVTPVATVARAPRGFTPAAGSEEDGAGPGPATGAVAAKSSLLGIAVSIGIALAFAAPGLDAPAPAPLGLKKLLISFKGLVFFCVSIVSGCAFRTDADARLTMEPPRMVRRKLFLL